MKEWTKDELKIVAKNLKECLRNAKEITEFPQTPPVNFMLERLENAIKLLDILCYRIEETKQDVLSADNLDQLREDVCEDLDDLKEELEFLEAGFQLSYKVLSKEKEND